jgi:hypothetical protein
MNEFLEGLAMIYGDDVETMMLADGLDEAFVGIATTFGEKIRAVYDVNRVIELLHSQGMSYEEAEEYFDYKIVGSYEGEQAPIFMHMMSVNNKQGGN